MYLRDLVKVIGMSDAYLPPAFADLDIACITADSRRVTAGGLFVAIDGTTINGSDFIPQAVQNGARVIISRSGNNMPLSIGGQVVLQLGMDTPRRALALLARGFYGAQPRRIAAITGTNGKTSTAEFLRQLWQIQGAHSASLGTLGLRAATLTLQVPPLTTPDPVCLADILHRLKCNDIDHVAIEASSHGLDQYRLDGVELHAAAFSNLTRDHLDYHENLNKYRNAKLRLFRDLLPRGGIAVVNADMEMETVTLLRRIALEKNLNLRTTGMGGESFRLIQTLPMANGQLLKLKLYGQQIDDVFLPLIGRFQADNAMLAAALAWEEKATAPEICARLSQLKGVPGRCEHVATLSNGATVFVDYAHTPDALQNLLVSLRPHTRGRLILVFGAGGNRDRGKRPLMGQVAAQLAEICIVTDDNPRDETPALIRRDVMQGCPDAIEVGDRYDAIKFAINCAKDGDIVVIAGKGHESGQTLKGVTHDFNDAGVVRTIVCAPGHEAASIEDKPQKGPHP